MKLYQKTKLSSDSTKDFGDKIDEKMKSYSHTAEAFSPILAQKPKLNQKEKNNPRDLFFGIVSTTTCIFRRYTYSNFFVIKFGILKQFGYR